MRSAGRVEVTNAFSEWQQCCVNDGRRGVPLGKLNNMLCHWWLVGLCAVNARLLPG